MSSAQSALRSEQIPDTGKKPPGSESKGSGTKVIQERGSWYPAPKAHSELTHRRCLRNLTQLTIILEIAQEQQDNPVRADDGGKPWADVPDSRWKYVHGLGNDENARREHQVSMKDLIDAGIVERKEGTSLYRNLYANWPKVKPYCERDAYTAKKAKRKADPSAPPPESTVVLHSDKSHTVTLKESIHSVRIENVDLPAIRAATYIKGGELIHRISLETPSHKPPPEPPKKASTRTIIRENSAKPLVFNKSSAQICAKINPVLLKHRGPVCDTGIGLQLAARFDAVHDIPELSELFAKRCAEQRWKKGDTAGLLLNLADEVIDKARHAAKARPAPKPANTNEPEPFSAEWHNQRDEKARKKREESQ